MTWTLARVASDPTCLESVDQSELPALIGEAETLRARLWARLQAPPVPVAAPSRALEPDRLLTVKEAAAALNVDTRWLYRKAGDLPFTRKIGTGTLRFSQRAMERWKESRK